MARAIGVAAIAALAWFYVTAASEHARVVNTSKARGDQSGYLFDAERVYANRHGQAPAFLIGERNRMPLYAGYLSLFYDRQLTDPEFFEVAKTWNIRLSLALLAVLAIVFKRHLPVLPAANLLLAIAFGYFIFKAGYGQSELLFYCLFFLTFLSACHLLASRSARRSATFAVTTGALAGLAHLTKAGVLPLLGVLLAVYATREGGLLLKGRRPLASLAGRVGAALIMVATFLSVIYPYISNSKRVYGQYFYNVNTTFYVWYENWPEASVGPYSHGDAIGWPNMPDEQLMSPAKYWRRHTIGQIANRIAGGFADIVVRSYTTFWFFKYTVLYLGLATALVAANFVAFVRWLREHAALAAFAALYAVVYLLATAFYEPTSGTGTARFLLVNIAPLLFTLSWFFTQPPFCETRFRAGAASFTVEHFHVLVLATIALDLAFSLWPRLMTTYGGF